MSSKRIYINDKLVETGELNFDPETFLHGNYIYAAVNSYDHAPLYLERHLHYACISYEKLYGISPQTNIKIIDDRIRDMLDANHQPRLGNIIHLYLLPPKDKDRTVDIVITHSHSTIYRGYELLSLRPQAIVVNYEIPFSGHRTAISLTGAQYMDQFAQRGGSNMALRSNRAGKIVSAGDYPVFGVKDNRVIVAPAGNGSLACVEQELMARACEISGIGTVEKELTVEHLPALDEIMVFTHTGIRSILSCGGNYYYNLVAAKLEKAMGTITSEGEMLL